MRIGILSSISALLAGSSLAFAQAPKDAVKPMPTTAPANGSPVTTMLQTEGPVCIDDGVGFTDYRFYARGEYLLWKFNGALLPAAIASRRFLSRAR